MYTLDTQLLSTILYIRVTTVVPSKRQDLLLTIKLLQTQLGDFNSYRLTPGVTDYSLPQ